MKSQSTYRTWFLALVLCLCALFSAYVIFKNFNQPAQITANISDEKDVEQKEEVKETADIFLLASNTLENLSLRSSLEKPIVNNEHIDYYHYVSPETPPPNC